MLSEDQINSLMLDKELSDVCEQVLGTPITEVCPQPGAVLAQSSSSSSQSNK